MTSLTGRNALVTGAGSGIGAAIARSLAKADARVVLTGRREAQLAQVGAGIREAGGDAAELSVDVRDFGAVSSAVAAAIERHGSLDIMVANAAIAEAGAIVDADPALYRDVIETNVVGVMNAVLAALPHMLERGSGHIVIVASLSGRVTYTGESAYVASKHATVAFADCLRQEVTRQGVRVSVIEPGLVETPLIHVYPGALDMVPDVEPLEPEDIARAVMFCLEQPPNVNVFEIALRPVSQVL